MEAYVDTTHKISYLLQHLNAVLSHQTDQVLQEQLGIGFSQFKILTVLRSNSAIQQKHIAERLGQTEASISRQIKLLTDQGLIAIRVRPENRREHLTTLTPRGLRFTEESVRIINNYHAPVFAQLSAKQQQQLIDILNVMHDVACTNNSAGDHSLQS